jgi:hypothetical protein
METTEQSPHGTNRRSFMPKGVAVGAGAAGVGRLLADPPTASALGGLTKGDVAILQFLTAAERGGVQDSEVPGGSGSQQQGRPQQIGRLTNLMQLTLDTSWRTRYRSDSQHPDFGDALPQAVPDLAVKQRPCYSTQRRRPQPARASASDRDPRAREHCSLLQRGRRARRVTAHRSQRHLGGAMSAANYGATDKRTRAGPGLLP